MTTSIDIWPDDPQYIESSWGDLIIGTAQQLQALGIGLDVIFPASKQARKWRGKGVDPRGLPCRLKFFSGSYDAPVFSASISFPGRDIPFTHLPSDWTVAPYPCIDIRLAMGSDHYRGSADALVRAGLVPEGHFPGETGMPKHTVRLSRSGELIGPKNRHLNKETGSCRITREKRGNFCVEIQIAPEHEAARRLDADKRFNQWKLDMLDLPRPPRLDAPAKLLNDHIARQRRSALRLVWSAPSA